MVAMIKDRYANFLIFGVFGFLVVLFSGFLLAIIKFNSPLFGVWSFVAFLLCAYSLKKMLFGRRFLLFSVLFFIFYSIFTPWLINWILEIPMTSWREGFEQTDDFVQALGCQLICLVFIVCLSELLISKYPPVLVGKINALGMGHGLMFFLSLLSAAIIVLIGATRNRDDYLLDADLGTMAAMQAGAMAVILCFVWALTNLNKISAKLSLIFIALSVVIVAASGFRFILVACVVSAFFCSLQFRSYRKSTIIIIALVSPALYMALLAGAAARAFGLTFDSVYEAFKSGLISLDLVFGYIGAAEQANMVAFAFYFDRHDYLLGQTYIDAFIRVMPNFLHTAIASTIRPQDYIAQNASFLPSVFLEGNWTMGAHVFIEALINFGPWLSFVPLSIIILILCNIERFARKNAHIFCIYIVVASYGYSLAWYGFGNWLKQSLTACFISYVCFFLVKIVNPVKNEVKHAQNKG